MQKQISVPYRLTLDDRSAMVLLYYNLEQENQSLSMQCFVEGAYPNDIGWLLVRNFQIRTYKTSKGYTQLFDDYEGATNLDTNLFIEQAFLAILDKENLKADLSIAA